jgi:uncharacterized protein YfdQ (DUF2303 family)
VTTNELASFATIDGASIARDLARSLAEAEQKPLIVAAGDQDVAHIYVLHDSDGRARIETVDLTSYLDRPVSKRGSVAHYTGESLAAYVNAHRVDPHTALYADVAAKKIVAILDGHGQHTPGEQAIGAPPTDDHSAGWGRHTSSLTVRNTPEWDHWRRLDGKLVDQQTLAEHILDGAGEITSPAAADMLELAESFQATSKVDFESASRLDSGQRRFTYSETVAAKAGRKGQLDIPTEFTLGVAPFEGSPAYSVTALFRYRINGGALAVGYKLVRPADVELHAFTDIVEDVETRTKLTAYRAARPA